ncbi:MAG: ribonuclease E/G [Pararhodobacter sp.]
MGKKLLIDATHAEETRVVVVDGHKVEEFDFETIHKRQLAGNIYLAKVTRVEPSLQAAFVDYGGNRHGFLAFAEIHPDYYQIPVADRKALIEEERAYAQAQQDDEGGRGKRGRGRPKPVADSEPATAAEATADTHADSPGAVQTVAAIADAPADAPDAIATREIAGMDIVDLDDDAEVGAGTGKAAREAAPMPPTRGNGNGNGEDYAEPYSAADHATEIDDQIESVADEDVSDEVRPLRRPRARRYKIQEVVKVRQIMLVQVVKEERGNKGAALTTYLSLAGRYCVLMPNTARGGGISRKITQATDRKKLKEIANEIEVPDGAGLIIRTAGANRTKAEIKRDYEYLSRLWEQIRDLTLKSIAPAPIYEEGNLIKRSIRDLYSREIDEVLVEGEHGYRVAKDFMKMIMPSHARNVKQYTDPLPLFARFQVESYLGAMFNPTVQLKSGGYIVIGITEALVAVDVNSGKSTREGSIEDTALKTNLEAAEEVARQLRLRDLAGLIVIDFIDMEERKNNAAVEKRLKEKLKNDRARIQVGRISGFGLLEMSRQRLRPGMLEATTQPCPHCHGTGLIRSDNSLGLTILRALEEEGTRNRTREVLVKAPIGIVNYLFNAKREHLAQIEARYGMAIRLEADPALVSPDYTIEKFKTATRIVAPAPVPVVSLDAQTMSDLDQEIDEAIESDEDSDTPAEDVVESRGEGRSESRTESAGDGAGEGGRKKRRRRRRRRGGADAGDADDSESTAGQGDGASQHTDDKEQAAKAAPAAEPAAEPTEAADEAAPTRKRRSRRKSPKAEAAEAEAVADQAELAEPAAEETAAPAPAETLDTPEADSKPAPKRRRTRKTATKATTTEAEVAGAGAGGKEAAEAPAAETVAAQAPTAEAAEPQPQAPEPPAPKDAAPAEVAAEAEAEAEAEVAAKAQPEPAVEVAQPANVAPDATSADEDDPAKPRRRGWWSLGR